MIAKILTCVFLAQFYSISVTASDKKPVPIIDRNTNLELPIYTHTSYGIKNQGTGLYRLWYQPNVHMFASYTDNKLDIWLPLQWTVFEPENDGWYNMRNRDAGRSHRVQWAKSLDQGYYYMYSNYSCDGNHPYKQIKEVNWHIVCGTPKANEQLYNWEFIVIYTVINQYYNVDITMNNFRYGRPLSSIIQQHKRLQTLQSTIINNCSPATLSEKVTVEKSLTQTYTVNVERSLMQASKYCKKFGITSEVGTELFGITASISASAELSWDVGQEQRDTQGTQVSTSSQFKVMVEKQVNVPQNECLKAISHVNWIERLSIPYTATVTATVTTKFGAPIDLIKATKLCKMLFGKDPWKGDREIKFNTSGELIGTFGLDTYMEVQKLGNKCDCEGESHDKNAINASIQQTTPIPSIHPLIHSTKSGSIRSYNYFFLSILIIMVNFIVIYLLL